MFNFRLGKYIVEACCLWIIDRRHQFDGLYRNFIVKQLVGTQNSVSFG